MNFEKRRHRRIQRLLENQLKKLKAEELPGMDEIEKLIKETQGTDKPMAKWARVIIETEEKNPKPIAIMTNNDCEVARGFVIRLLPSNRPGGVILDLKNSKKFKSIVCMDIEFTDCIVEKIKNPFSDEHTFIKVTEKGKTYYLNLDYVIFYEI